MAFKCEICRENDAKVQYFTPQGQELYVCKPCFDKQKSLEHDFFDIDVNEFVSDNSSHMNTNQTIATVILAGFFRLRQKYLPMHPMSFTFSDKDSISELNANLSFFPEEKLITWNFTVSGKEETYTYSWVFDLRDLKDIGGRLTSASGTARTSIGLKEVGNDMWDLMNMVGHNMVEGARPAKN